jgi:hypothetical protein
MIDKETINKLKKREKEILKELDFIKYFEYNFYTNKDLEEELYEIVDTLKKLEVKEVKYE